MPKFTIARWQLARRNAPPNNPSCTDGIRGKIIHRTQGGDGMTDTTPARVIASTVSTLPASAAERFGDRPAVRYKEGEEWRELSYTEAGKAIEEIALGLVSLGIEVGDRVCVLANTRLDWTLASFGISAAGAVVVPIY